MEKNLDITNPRFNERIWSVPSNFVKSRFLFDFVKSRFLSDRMTYLYIDLKSYFHLYSPIINTAKYFGFRNQSLSCFRYCSFAFCRLAHNSFVERLILLISYKILLMMAVKLKKKPLHATEHTVIAFSRN